MCHAPSLARHGPLRSASLGRVPAVTPPRRPGVGFARQGRGRRALRLSEAHVADAEQQLGARFPEEYRSFLLEVACGSVREAAGRAGYGSSRTGSASGDQNDHGSPSGPSTPYSRTPYGWSVGG